MGLMSYECICFLLSSWEMALTYFWLPLNEVGSVPHQQDLLNACSFWDSEIYWFKFHGGFQAPEKKHDGESVPPRSCPWCRQHLHIHRRSQTFSWMWQRTWMTKPVLCGRAGYLMHWRRQRGGGKKDEAIIIHDTNADTKQCSLSRPDKDENSCGNFPTAGILFNVMFLFVMFLFFFL